MAASQREESVFTKSQLRPDSTPPEKQNEKVAPTTPHLRKAQRMMETKKSGVIPHWWKDACHSKRAWMYFIRCLICTFAVMVCLVVPKSLNTMGDAAFFALLCTQMVAPTMPLAGFMFALVTMGIGFFIGWGWGNAGWAAAHAVRNQAKAQAVMANIMSTLAPNLSAESQVTQAIMQGQFLDPASSAVVAVFLFLGTYLFGWMRAKAPNLTATSVFGTIILDLVCSFGPLFPTPNFKLAYTLLIPSGVFMGIAVACTVLIYPETVSHMLVEGVVHKALGPLQQLLELENQILTTRPSDQETWRVLTKKAYILRGMFMKADSSLMEQSKSVQLEVSHGRIGAGQVEELIKRTRELGIRGFGLGSFVLMVEERFNNMRIHKERPLPYTSHALSQALDSSAKAETSEGRTLEDLIPALESCTRTLRRASQAGLNSASTYLNMINTHRWSADPPNVPTTQNRQDVLNHLRDALDDFCKNKHHTLLDRFQDMFDPETGDLKSMTEKYLVGQFRGLFNCFTFTTALISFSSYLIHYLELIIEIDVSNPKNKFQFPGKFVSATIENITDPTTDNENNMGVTDELADNESAEASNSRQRNRTYKRKLYARDPDAGPPKNGYQKFARLVSRVWKGATGPNGIFAFKYGIISVAMWVPAVCRPTAYFFQEKRGMWAQIMAQTGLGIYAGEQILTIMSNACATIIGCIVGIVIWYIGAGRGSGNPYGMTAALTVIIAPFLFLRTSAPASVSSFYLTITVSICFVVGFGWVDQHVVQATHLGSGATLALRRALLVLLGCAGSFVISLIPKPTSAKVLVRQGTAKNIGALGELYGLDVMSFEQSRNDIPEDVDAKERRDRFRSQFMAIFSRIENLYTRVGYAHFEPPMKGPWPQHTYIKILRVQQQMLAASSVIAAAYAQMEPEWIKRLTDHCDVMQPTFVADCLSLFTLLRHSLRSGTPLPPTIPIFERLAFTRKSLRLRTALSRRGSFNNPATGTSPNASSPYLSVPGQTGASLSRTSSRSSGGGGPDVPERSPQRPGGAAAQSSASIASSTTTLQGDDQKQEDLTIYDTFQHTLTWENCQDEQFPIFATAVLAFNHLIGGLNQLHRCVVDLVGEADLDGFESAVDRWADAEADV